MIRLNHFHFKRVRFNKTKKLNKLFVLNGLYRGLFQKNCSCSYKNLRKSFFHELFSDVIHIFSKINFENSFLGGKVKFEGVKLVCSLECCRFCIYAVSTRWRWLHRCLFDCRPTLSLLVLLFIFFDFFSFSLENSHYHSTTAIIELTPSQLFKHFSLSISLLFYLSFSIIAYFYSCIGLFICFYFSSSSCLFHPYSCHYLAVSFSITSPHFISLFLS